MKKLLLSTALLAFMVPATAMAEHHGDGGDKHGGGMFAQKDTNGDGAISKEEFLDHAAQKFTKLDTDGDGSVTKEELGAAREKWKEHRKGKREKMKERHKERHGEGHDDRGDHSDDSAEE